MRITKTNLIYNEDCLEGMKRIPDRSIDMILCDLPYGTTANTWDSVIPFDLLWVQYERIIKDNGAIVLTASQPFTTEVIASNKKIFRYELIWEKDNATGFLAAHIKPMKIHENILVFYKSTPKYNPQMRDGFAAYKAKNGMGSTNYRQQREVVTESDGKRFPISILKFKRDKEKSHPTQKPVALFEYLIKTFTDKNEIVLDNCMGSGTTAIACLNTDRRYIGYETNKDYFEMSLDRIKNNTTQLDLFG
ncbi:site-specific DNA-methyltransferase (adenine-specific) [Enterococcus sp. AZ135]